MRALRYLLTRDAPSRRAGLVAAVVLVAACTAIIYPLKQAAPVVSLGVVYMLAVLVVSITWGLALGIGTALLSALAFNYFHLPPVGRLTIGDSENVVALCTFTVAAVLASSVAEVTRARAREASGRRDEADLAAEMARLLLRGGRLDETLPTATARLSEALRLGSASIELADVSGDERRLAFALSDGDRRLGTLLVPASTPQATLRRLKARIVPSLEGLLSAALERESLLAGVVETAALRRADVVKTALLRTVSHDLRTPLTAIAAAGEALRSPLLSTDERAEMAGVVRSETERLSRLVDNLLDLSRLQAGAAAPRIAWASTDEVIGTALLDMGAGPEEFSVSVGAELPLVRADPAQLERAFVNVLENARRHSNGHPVSVRARTVRGLADGRERERLVVRVVDRGPGIAPADIERVFEPFYRAGDGDHRGSGLGLAIARGLTEANGGHLHVESLPGQGSSFVFELPVPAGEQDEMETPQ